MQALKAKTNILVVDDEPKILEVVTALLEKKDFQVFAAANGSQALEIFQRENIALVLLDLMLPDMSGETVCAAIRRKSRIPVIMLTARTDEESIVDGFARGADDYITKPFGLMELLARVTAVLRRSEGEGRPLAARNTWGEGALMVDFEKNEVYKRGADVPLTPSEFKILTALVQHPGKVFSRDALIRLALGEDFDGYDRAIDSHIKNLRKKLEDDPRSPIYVKTVPGLGYKFGGE